MNKTLSLGEYIVTGLVIALTFYAVLITHHTETALASTLIYLSILYIVTRFLLIIYPKQLNRILLLLITAYCGYEVFCGYSQLLGVSRSRNYLFALTGSFENPGPYGGFLAVCISILGAYAYTNKASLSKRSWLMIPHWIIVTVVILSIIILPATQSRTAILAVLCSSVCLFVKTVNPTTIKIKRFFKKNGLWMSIVAIGLIATTYMLKKPSADGRFFIDKICILTICDNGMKGVGPGKFRGAYGETQARYFYNQIQEKGSDELDWAAINEKERMTADCPRSAFNEYLHVGVEYGPIVMLLMLLLFITAIKVSYEKDGIWCYGLIALAVFALFSYPLHVKQFQIMIPILLATCVTNHDVTFKKTEIACLIVSLSFFLFILKKMVPEIRQYRHAVASWNELKHWYDLGYYDFVVEDGESLLKYLKHNEYFVYAYGLSLNKTGHYEYSDTILKLGVEISNNPMFWNIMGNNSLSQGQIDEAEKLYKHAFYMVPNRLYPLTLIANMYHETGDTIHFQETLKTVESFIPKVESVTTDSLRNNIKKLL